MQKPQNPRCVLSPWGRFVLILIPIAITCAATAAWRSARATSFQIAQASTPRPALSESEVRDCLCMERQMAADREDLDHRWSRLSERQQELAKLDQQVRQQRAALSPTDRIGQQVLKDLMSQQQSLRELMQHDLQSPYNAEVNQLNALIDKYNGLCVDRPRYETDVRAAQQNLQCPKP